MLKLNAYLKEKNVKFSSKRNKPKIELIQNNSVPTQEMFISSLIYEIEVGSKLDKLMIYRRF